MKKLIVKFITLQRFFLYLLIISGIIGSTFGAIKVGPVHLFPYRFFLVLLWYLFIMNFFLCQSRLKIPHIKVKRYLQFLALWFFYALLTLSWAASKTDAMRHIIFLLMGFSIIFFIVYYLTELNQLKALYYLWLLIYILLIPVS